MLINKKEPFGLFLGICYEVHHILAGIPMDENEGNDNSFFLLYFNFSKIKGIASGLIAPISINSSDLTIFNVVVLYF